MKSKLIPVWLLTALFGVNYSANAVQNCMSLPSPFFEKVSSLKAVNKKESAESYPFMSHNGLHLYYTKPNGDMTSLMRCIRNTQGASFGNPETILEDLPSSAYSLWMNAEETQLWYVASGKLYHRSRINPLAPFSIEKDVKLMGRTLNYISQPSLTPDEKELYLYESGDGQQSILVFDKDGNGFTFKHAYSSFNGLMPGPGQLTKDGKGFLLSLEKDKESQGIFELVRGTLFEKFNLCVPVSIHHPQKTYRDMLQPSISANRASIAYVGGNKNSWEENDILLTEKPISEPTFVKLDIQPSDIIPQEIIEDPQVIPDLKPNPEPVPFIPELNADKNFKVYPNPFVESATLEFYVEHPGTLTIEVYALDGRKIKSVFHQHVETGIQRHTLTHEGLSPGTYIVNIRMNDWQLNNRVIFTGQP